MSVGHIFDPLRERFGDPRTIFAFVHLQVSLVHQEVDDIQPDTAGDDVLAEPLALALILFPLGCRASPGTHDPLFLFEVVGRACRRAPLISTTDVPTKWKR
ncbi:hypothetical protein P0R31_10855 [Bradyrhizobium yuanmingense]|uniref:hypothetical protein n=1 Tax=Bradyrhizobium yuanmingense TaxID=108015 RepID=UPI0023B96F81|nr:hypothetical protein [Bradyrhizobium yuanmingense]MDF0517731.1 hypothetical protein [Bradyrhizobium yuanmingense]